MLQTYKRIIQEFQLEANRHKQIKSFHFGKIDNISTKDMLFPICWIAPSTTTVQGNIVNVGFELIILDILSQDLTNELDGLNDTLQIGVDFISKFWDKKYNDNWKVVTENGIDFEPVDGEFDDHCIGHRAIIEVEVFESLCEDKIPDYTNYIPDYTAPTTETKYYIKSIDDIYGFNMTNTITDVDDTSVPGSEVFTFQYGNFNFEEDDYVAYGYSTLRYVSDFGTYQVTDIDIVKQQITVNSIDYKTKEYGRIAKLTPFTYATYSTAYECSQVSDFTLTHIGDITGTFSIGDYVRITNTTTGKVYYDIIRKIKYGSGVTTVVLYMTFYSDTYLNNDLTIEKMTNIT